MKDYNKLVREIGKLPDFAFIKTGRSPTVKLVHTPSNSIYSIHPGDNAIKPLKKWINKQENGK